jgi:hypothetical protein
MTKTTPFWQSIQELAAMRDHIPEERREMSGVRDAVRLDVRTPSRISTGGGHDQQQNVRGH